MQALRQHGPPSAGLVRRAARTKLSGCRRASLELVSASLCRGGQAALGNCGSDLAALVDFVNVGPSNLIWGRPLQSIVPSGRPIEWELTYGVAPALLLLFLATGVSLVFLRRRRSWLGAVNSLPGAEYARAMAIAVFVAWILMVIVNGGSLWRYVYYWGAGCFCDSCSLQVSVRPSTGSRVRRRVRPRRALASR